MQLCRLALVLPRRASKRHVFSSIGSSCERLRPRPDTYFKISGRQRRKLATYGTTYILFKHCISTLMRKTEKQRKLKGVTCIQNSGHNKSKDISIFRIEHNQYLYRLIVWAKVDVFHHWPFQNGAFVLVLCLYC